MKRPEAQAATFDFLLILEPAAGPWDTVEVSLFGVVGVSYASLKSESTDDDFDSKLTSTGSATTFGLGAGMAFDYRLLDDLYLRFSALVGKVNYTTAKSDSEYEIDGDSETVDDVESTSFIGGLEFKPSIQLRMTF